MQEISTLKNDDVTSAQIDAKRAEADKAGKAKMEEMRGKNLTPAMAQYLEIKDEHPEYILFYRMGDFYELFFEDAVTVSGALGLTLTSRSKNDEGREIPMCGVPFHAYEIYLARLIKMGYKVAICEQMEDPKEAKKRGAKAVVRREVVRLVTAGTLTEDTLLEAKKNNFIVTAVVRANEIGVSWLDISTGAFYVQSLPVGQTAGHVVLSTALARLAPVEVLIEDKLLECPDYFSLFGEYRDELSVWPRARFNLESATKSLLSVYKVQSMEVFGDFTRAETIAAGTLVDYVRATQKGQLPSLKNLVKVQGDKILEIDAATRRSLELLNSLSGNGISLLKVIDRTVTGVGGRLLAQRLAMPLLDEKEINDRLDMVSFFVENPNLRAELRHILAQCLDMERAVQRLSIGRGGPRDLYDLAVTLRQIPRLKAVILELKNFQPDSVYTMPPLSLYNLVKTFFDHSGLAAGILGKLPEEREDIPTLVRNGGFIREGADVPLDYLRNIRAESEGRCERLREQYAQETGVAGLKIKSNSVIGYYVEVPSKSADALLSNSRFIHRQSVLNAVRFTTLELSELESEVVSSEEKALEMELKLFETMVEDVMAQVHVISESANIMAQLDVAASLAEVAVERGYVRPQLNDGLEFEVIDGRHPVVEAALKASDNTSFVGNDCVLKQKDDRLWLLTGPNMAGKSTFLRQNALIAVLAQMGAFVPAKKATIGIVDKIFSRVGASDDLARGRSTFMVEMVETAAILNRATERSFVILDEIGRGTATFDGLSIAWAVVEHLAEINKCRTIFATHYHELTKLCTKLKSLSLHCMKTKEFNNDVVFMHEVVCGAADRSYGIHVARLAGLPKLTIKRAEQVLKLLEEEKKSKVITAVEDDLPLFEALKDTVEEAPKVEATPVEPEVVVLPHPLIDELKALDVDGLSPREALAKLYELKAKI